MIVELSSVGSTPKVVEASFPHDEIDLEDSYRVVDRIELIGSLIRDDRGVHLAGKIKGDIEVSCSRCLEPAVVNLDLDFADVFVDPSLEKSDDEAEIEGDDLDESLVENGVIDLADVAREQVILALPDRTLCKEDCKGLCPQCGGNRNLIDCSCEEREKDPRWAALKNLN